MITLEETWPRFYPALSQKMCHDYDNYNSVWRNRMEYIFMLTGFDCISKIALSYQALLISILRSILLLPCQEI